MTSIVGRMVGAATLNRAIYNEVEHDESATSQAATVVIIAALAAGIGGALSSVLSGVGSPIGGLLGGLLSGLVGWLAYSFVAYIVGTSIFKGTATYGELLRTLGFAETPAILNILAFIPILGGLIGFVVFLWRLATGYTAVKEALDISTGATIGTIIISFIVLVVVYAIIGIIMGIIFGVGSLLSGAVTAP